MYQRNGPMNPPPATTEGADPKSSPSTVVLHGRRLFFARAAWVALAALTVGLFVWSVLITYEQLSTVCEGNAGCDFLRLSPKDAKVLEGLGLSVGSYAAYNVALCIVSALGYWAIGAILFWKSSGHRVALYASVALVTFGAIQVDTLHWLAEAYPMWASCLAGRAGRRLRGSPTGCSTPSFRTPRLSAQETGP